MRRPRLPKYEVEMSQQISRWLEVIVEADSEDEARDLAWDISDSAPESWHEKIRDSDSYVRLIKDQG